MVNKHILMSFSCYNTILCFRCNNIDSYENVEWMNMSQYLLSHVDLSSGKKQLANTFSIYETFLCTLRQIKLNLSDFAATETSFIEIHQQREELNSEI